MNDEMDGDEVILGLLSFILAAGSIGRWMVHVRLGWRLRAHPLTRAIVLGVPAVCLGVMAFVLVRWADAEVRHDSRYISLLMFLGIAWLAGASGFFAGLGVNLRDDGLERNNVAAAVAWAGAMGGVTCCYAGANIGSGPSLWNNVFSALLATGTLAAIGLALESASTISTSIGLERDVASGVRAGGCLLAAGLLLGRAVAGDWHSTLATLTDFAREGWPALPLVLAAFGCERALRPTARRVVAPIPTHGIAPALGYLLLALGWLAYRGSWETHR